MEVKKLKATLTTGEDREKLTLRIWVSDEDISSFVLQKGQQPDGLFKVVVMQGGDE